MRYPSYTVESGVNTRSASSRVALRWLMAKPEYSNYLEKKKRQNKKPLSKEEWEAKVKPDEWGKEPEPTPAPPDREDPEAAPSEESPGDSPEPEEDHRAEGEAAKPEAEARKKKKLQEAQAAADATRKQLKGVGLSEDERTELLAKLKKLDAIAATLMGTSPEQYDDEHRDRDPLEFRSLSDSDPKVTAAAKKFGITDTHLKKFVDEVEGDPKLVKKKTRLRKEWRDYRQSKSAWDKVQAYQADKAEYDSDIEKYEAYDEDEAEAAWKESVEKWEKKPKADRGAKPKPPTPPKEPKPPKEPPKLNVKEPEAPDEPEPDEEAELTVKQKFEAFKKHATPESKEKLKGMTLGEFEDLMDAWAGGKSGGSRRASLRVSVIRLAYTLSEGNLLRARLLRVLA